MHSLPDTPPFPPRSRRCAGKPLRQGGKYATFKNVPPRWPCYTLTALLCSVTTIRDEKLTLACELCSVGLNERAPVTAQSKIPKEHLDFHPALI